MKKIILSDSGPEISSSIYSFWRWINPADLALDRVKEIIEFNLQLGINTFDVSPTYGNGELSVLFGQAVKELGIPRKNIVLISKMGHRVLSISGAIQYTEWSEETLNRRVGDQLQLLGTNYLDVLLIDGYDPLVSVDELASTLKSLQIRGYIHHLGLSEFTTQQHQLLASRLPGDIVTNHIEFNLLNTRALEDGRIHFIKENYATPMAFSPLADGRIASGWDPLAVRVRAGLDLLTRKYQSNIEQLAVAWINKLGATPVIGSLSTDRIKNAATAENIELSHEDWHSLYQLTLQPAV
ncbi:MAG TPA: aldo/keto reductase [Luteibaculaceae bacterium]|nr:aldo/keto reductase [Luteibaculaceae bacterium]